MTERAASVVVIGAGQAGLAAGYYLRRNGFAPHTGYVLLDDAAGPGGAWQHGWKSLRLFSPSEFSSLPGRPMPPWSPGFPPASHVRQYLAGYEQRYELPVKRRVRVTAVHRNSAAPKALRVETRVGTWQADAVISATGSWSRPFWPYYPGMRGFRGRQLHTTGYRAPEEFTGQRVVVVGGGNSAAQILAEVSTVTDTLWVTPRPPRYLPDDIDGRVLFQVATARRAALSAGCSDTGGVAALGDIVMVPSVVDARARGVLNARPPFTRLAPAGPVWPDGHLEPADTIIWCTGFRPALGHLAPLRLPHTDGHVSTDGTAASGDPRVRLIGYGDWTGPASATLIGVGRTARDAVAQLACIL